ncbi:MAG: tRNA(Ile)-lysidine synthase [Smithella sp. PtaU1.Bin162]|nr:MAG: tRNA(Ile)-lysidine synthase [Smithella sp. PtaU1.Bin162]
MIEKVKQTIIKYGLLKNNERVVVGFSGGPDSTALVLTLAQIAPSIGAQLIIAHFNHGLRGQESNEDERFARKLAKKMNLTFISGKMNTEDDRKSLSPEDFYRRQRYRFFNEVAKNNRAVKIALGHNLQDQAETVLLHLLRGSGLEGLKGILPLRDGKYIRPLIETTRQEIISFLDKEKITYRRDSSNADKNHLRNKIRLELLPYLKKEFNPQIDVTIAQMAEIIRDENVFINECVDKALKSPYIQSGKNKIVMNMEYLGSLPVAIHRRLLKELLEDFNTQKNGVTFLHINLISNLLRNPESGKKISLPGGIQARHEYESLILERGAPGEKSVKYEYRVEIPGSIYLKERDMTVSMHLRKKDKIDFHNKNKNYFDLNKIRFPLVLRNRREGDWFQPLGMVGRQKLKSFFIDHKISRQKRDEIMLLADEQSILWIENMHLNDRVKITPETKKVLELEII